MARGYHIAPLEPDILIVQVCINDLKTIPLYPEQKEQIIGHCQQQIAEIVAEGKAQGATIILTTIFPVGKIPLNRQIFWSSEVNQAVLAVNHFIETLAGEQVIIFDAFALLVGDDGDIQPQYAQDELHLNGAGYARLNEELITILEGFD